MCISDYINSLHSDWLERLLTVLETMCLSQYQDIGPMCEIDD